MATYVAFNVQNFPDSSTAGDSILAVRADLSDSVAGGLSITAFTGVASVSVQALGAHQSASGTGSGTTIADAGSISVSAGALGYGRTLWNARVGLGAAAGCTCF